jgi:hypothetical protein
MLYLDMFHLLQVESFFPMAWTSTPKNGERRNPTSFNRRGMRRQGDTTLTESNCLVGNSIVERPVSDRIWQSTGEEAALRRGRQGLDQVQDDRDYPGRDVA